MTVTTAIGWARIVLERGDNRRRHRTEFERLERVHWLEAGIALLGTDRVVVGEDYDGKYIGVTDGRGTWVRRRRGATWAIALGRFTVSSAGGYA